MARYVCIYINNYNDDSYARTHTWTGIRETQELITTLFSLTGTSTYFEAAFTLK
jgi:hypothetical protein